MSNRQTAMMTMLRWKQITNNMHGWEKQDKKSNKTEFHGKFYWEMSRMVVTIW